MKEGKLEREARKGFKELLTPHKLAETLSSKAASREDYFLATALYATGYITPFILLGAAVATTYELYKLGENLFS